MAEYAPPIDEREGLEEFASFQGLRNNTAAESFSKEDLVTALNVDIDDSLGISRRKGFSAAATTAVDRGLFASGSICLGVGSNSLKLVNPDWTTTTLRTGLTASKHLSYAVAGDRVFYSNSVETGCVQGSVHRTWGLEVPGMPVATATGGTLTAGKYQYAVTFLRNDGQESGACKAGTIELTDIGGISLSSISVSSDPTVTYKAVYMSSVGGETLFRAGLVANATTEFSIREPRMGASPLLTQFMGPPPAGSFLGYYGGLMLVAKENRLYPSEPYAPELFDVRKSVPFSDKITMVAPVKNGLWVGTDSQILWLDGAVPEKWDFKVVAEYGVVSGALTYNDSELIGDGSAAGDSVAFFVTKRGLRVGHLGGRLVNLDRDRFAYPSQPRGAGIVRRHRGMAQFVATLQGVETAGNSVA